MSGKDACKFRPPSRAKRKLCCLFQDGGEKPECSQRRSRKCSAIQTSVSLLSSSFLRSSKTDSTSKHCLLTGDSAKECQEMFGCKQTKVPSQNNLNVSNPPCSSAQTLNLRYSYTGIVTRRKYKSMLSSVNGDTSSGFKSLQSFVKSAVPSFDCVSNTSEYGTASDTSRNCSLGAGASPRSSHSSHCDSISGIESFPSSNDDEGIAVSLRRHEIDFESGISKSIDLSNSGWESDNSESAIHESSEWDSKMDENLEVPAVTLLRADQVTAIIPTVNCSDYRGKFKIQLIEGDDGEFYRHGLYCGMRIHHVSAVVSMEPHGVQFHEQAPALLVIPLRVVPQDETWLSCLCSNTCNGQLPQWKRLPKKDYAYRSGCLVITTSHFSLFTVILEEPYPEVMKHIRCRTGGRMRISDVPGVEVEFPRGCLEQDVDAYVRVLFDSEPSFQSDLHEQQSERALASPVIMLGPHGYQFNPQRQPVRISLPVPHYEDIILRFGSQAQLSVWQSSTREGEPVVWEKLDVPLSEPSVVCCGTYSVHVVSFPVHHFSFFKLVWDVLVSSLYEAKMGMSYFYPYISFSMMCQAFMEESTGDNRFALEVICYRSDRCLPEATNYRHRVGASLKPKLVRPGRILVRLRSQMFEADVEAGEDVDMSKEEPDFRGRDFEKQYACRFKRDVNVERGTFGKVIVERIVTAGKDPLFEFNLHKTGLETEASLPIGCERWTVFAMKELASSLQITEGNNWKKFAQHIGYTKNEIKSKLQYTADPFLAMMNLYNSRGGTPEEFTQALYAVSRELRLGTSNTPGSNSDHSSSRSGGSHGSDSKASSSRDSKDKPSRGFQLWGFRPWGAVNNQSESGESFQGVNDKDEKGKKRPFPASSKKSVKGKRRKFSDISETISSSSSDEANDQDEIPSHSSNHKNNPRKLNDRDLWRISAKIVRKDWRNLGRTLGIEEQVLVNLEHAHQSIGFRECAYQMLLEWKGRKPRKCTFGELYTALLREDMVSVAKHMVSLDDDLGENV